MEQINKLKKEYEESFTKANEYRTKLMDEVKKTESSMEQLRGAYQALERLSTQLAPAEQAEAPKLSAVPDSDANETATEEHVETPENTEAASN